MSSPRSSPKPMCWCPTITDRIDGGAAGPRHEHLRLIANFGAGVDHIDLASCLQRGITVTNTPGVLTEDTADMTMALILAVPRRLAEGTRIMREGRFEGWSPTWMLGHRITGKKLGIIGMGRIGQAVAKRARAFGLDINYHNRRRVHARSRRIWARPIGRAWIRCWRAWISSRSIARTRRRHSICFRRGGSS